MFATADCNYQNDACCPADFIQDGSFGNKICDFEKGFGSNTEFCEYDKGDCIDYNNNYCSKGDFCCPIYIYNRTSFGDGRACNGGIAATALCNYDNNDCSEFNRDYPECPLEDLSEIDGSGNVILGNDVCDSGIYNSNECGWEFKDCAVGQVGQDVQISVRIIFAAMSQDGSTLAVVPFPSLARSIILFRYDIGQRMCVDRIYK